MAKLVSLGRSLAAAALLSGCNAYYNAPGPDDLMKLVPWFDHMVKSPAVHPYKRADIPRYTVKGTVPITGGEADWGTGDPSKLQYAFDTLAANRLVNPVAGDATTLAQGDTLFHTFCAVCHGVAAAGDGPVGPKVGAPSLLTDKAKGYADGYLYSIIRYGRGVMPQYGDKVYAPAQRWAIVNYLRKLQNGESGAESAAAGAAAPAPGGATR